MSEARIAAGDLLPLSVRVLAVEPCDPPLYLLAPVAGPRFWLTEEQIRRRESPDAIRVGDRARDVSGFVNGTIEWLVVGVDGDEAWCRSADQSQIRTTLPVSSLRPVASPIRAGVASPSARAPGGEAAPTP